MAVSSLYKALWDCGKFTQQGFVGLCQVYTTRLCGTVFIQLGFLWLLNLYKSLWGCVKFIQQGFVGLC